LTNFSRPTNHWLNFLFLSKSSERKDNDPWLCWGHLGNLSLKVAEVAYVGSSKSYLFGPHVYATHNCFAEIHVGCMPHHLVPISSVIIWKVTLWMAYSFPSFMPELMGWLFTFCADKNSTKSQKHLIYNTQWWQRILLRWKVSQ
jgi:hypothetical protein